MKHLYTIGHSTRHLNEFIEILNTFSIVHLVDVRSIPRSRTVPWFNKEKLSLSLQKVDIGYTHLKLLGGLRHPIKASINMGWRNKSFRGYADYMQTPDFFAGLKALNEIIKHRDAVAIMCAEALPWRCHRSMIADAEIVRKYKVLNIISKTKATYHKLTAFAKIDRHKRPIQVYYPEV